MGEPTPEPDGTVRREPGAATGLVEQVLLQLERAGFEQAPRFLGRDEAGREILTYLPGTVVHESPRFDPILLHSIGVSIRRFHDIMADSGLAGGAETVGHGNLGPHSLVVEPERLVGIISWRDYVAPTSRRSDLAHAVWYTADIGEQGPDLQRQGRNARVLCDGYGDGDHDAVLAALAARFERARRTHLRAGRAPSVEIFDRKLRWLHTHTPRLLALMADGETPRSLASPGSAEH